MGIAVLITTETDENIKLYYMVRRRQELYAHGFAAEHALYYFNSKKQGELDFLLEYDNHVLPIEVKSGKDYARHNALSNVMGNDEYDIPQAYVFCNENVQVNSRVAYLPIYMIALLEQMAVEENIYHFDLTGLSPFHGFNP